MSRLHDCLSGFLNVVCSFVNRHRAIDEASGAADSLKSDGYSTGVSSVSELANSCKQTSALNSASDISVVASASTSSDSTSNTISTSTDTSASTSASSSNRFSHIFSHNYAFRRAILALLVAAATIVTMLIVPPAKQANAAQVWWDYAGNGYVTSTGSWVGDAVNQINMPYPTIEDVNYNGEARKKITWTVTFNSQGIGAKSASQNQFPEGNQPSKGSAYGGQPTLYAWLPSGIEDSSIKIYREVTVRKTWGGVTDFDWQKARSSKEFPGNSPGDYTGYVFGDLGTSRWTYYKGDKNFEGHDWDKSLGPGTGSKVEGVGAGSYGKYANDYDMCEVYSWKREKKFSRVFISQEKDDSTISHRWTISAIVDRGQNPLLLTFAAGWISAKEFKTRFVVSGPFDTDGDGIPDSVEHHHNMNPKSPDDILYPQFNESMLKDYGKDNVPITTYGRKITEKPYIKTGSWQGNSSEGKFVYDGGTSTDLPTDLGIKYSITSISDSTIKIANSPNNISEGYAYIDPNTGHLTYNPRKEDRNKTITFHTKISYPNSGSYNCKHKNAKEFTHDTKIKVVSQASIYNPHYETLKDVEPTSTGISNPPKSVKDPSKKNYEFIKSGDLPNGTTFKIRKYYESKNYKGKDNQKITPGNKLSWSEIKKDDEKITSGNKGTAGRVYFTPGYAENGEKNKTSVVVTYPDGSSSEDEDAGNVDKSVNFKSKTFDEKDLDKNVVYAPVEVKKLSLTNRDLHLDFHKWTKPNNLQEYDGGPTYNPLGSNEVLKFARTVPIDPQVMLDSWSSKGVGQIDFRAICYKKNGEKKSDFTFLKPQTNNFNGLSLGKTFKFTHASTDDDNKCKNAGKNGSSCQFNKYIYSWESSSTTERSRAAISGTPRENGKFGCRVYALRKDKSTDFAANLDSAVTSLGTASVYSSFTQNLPTVTHKDFNFEVNSMSHYYNPKYETISMEAGTKKATEVPKSKKNANDANTLQADVREGDLPDGTWFELKGSLSYAFFEDDQDNKADSSNSAKNPKGKFGRVTFRPHRWFPATTEGNPDKKQVIVHYKDGSTSENSDSGNNGKPIYATVNITRLHDEDSGNLHLNVGDKEGSTDWQDTTIKLNKGDELNTTNKTTRWLDSWSKYKPGKINLRTICNKINSDGTKSHYQSDGIAGIKMQEVKIWNHTENAADQKACEKDANQCHPDKQLYDDYIANGNSRDTTERTRGWIKGKANESGDYECVVYAIKAKQFKKDNNDLLARFDAAVGALNKDASKNNTDPLKDFKWKLDGNNGNKNAVKGVDYEYRVIPIHILSMAHLYNPKYVDVSVKAGNKVVAAKPKSVKGSNGATEDQDDVKGDSSNPADLPDGTWFEIKKYDKAKDSKEPLNWSFMAKQKGSKPDSHNTSGEVTFHPDVTISATDYATPVVVHYKDGSTSEDEDAGNQGKPVYAKVNVTGLVNPGNDLHMTLRKSEDTDSPLNYYNSLYVMNGLNLLRNPFVQAWSVKDKSEISLRMMCTKSGENKWSRGLNSTLNIHLDNNYGEGSAKWNFASDDQQRKCRENGECSVDHVLYGFTHKDTADGSIENAVARREEKIVGAPVKAGDYDCIAFALKPAALNIFNTASTSNLIENGAYTTNNMSSIDFSKVKAHVDWERISFKVHVVDKFSLPKTGGDGMNMALLVLMIIGMFVMCGAFFVDQTKWGHTLLESLLRKALIKDFICKTAKKLRALRRLGERWRC